jgi:ABC-type branched-subunit amino acid transport system substrate-binding protein
MGRRLASLALLLVALFGCRGRSIPASVGDPVRIGVVLPQTGGLAQDGQAWVRAVRLAADEVNAAGGVLGGRRVELLVVDSATDANAGVTGAMQVIDQGAVVVIGDGGSSGSLAIYEMVTRPETTPQLSGSATSTSLTTASASTAATDRYFFRTAPQDGYQAQVVDRIATMHASCTRLAILYQNDTYGMPLATAISDIYATHGTVTGMVSFEPAQASYDTETAMVSGMTPDCVALISYPQDAGIILRSWHDHSYPMVQWIGTDGLFSDDFLAEAGSSPLVDGFYGASPLTTPATPEFGDFAARYHTAYGHDPENFAANYYDATALALLAIERAGSTEGAAIRDALHEIGGPGGTVVVRPAALRDALAALTSSSPHRLDYDGASGPITFDANGDTVAPYEIWQITGMPAAFNQVAVVQAMDLTVTP